MSTEIEVPTPPDNTNRGIPNTTDTGTVTNEFDLRRGEPEQILRQNAWRVDFEEWRHDTDLSGGDIERAQELQPGVGFLLGRRSRATPIPEAGSH